MQQQCCRYCGCTEHAACVDEDGLACYWIALGVCSFCALLDEQLARYVYVAGVAHLLAGEIQHYSYEAREYAAVLYRQATVSV